LEIQKVANTSSAKKRVRQSVQRTALNRSRVSRIRTFLRKLEDAIEKGDAAGAQYAFVAAEPELRRGVTKGVLHGNTVSRKISRLSRKVKALQTGAV
jgi:small subunit ribosomal protein S20